MARSKKRTLQGTFPENQFGHPEISHQQLKLDMIPSSRAAWLPIAQFALTYDGYRHKEGVAGCGAIANSARARYWKDRKLPRSLDHLRTCLFFEQRRFRHFGDSPSGEDLAYIRSIVLAIRKLVKARQERDALD